MVAWRDTTQPLVVQLLYPVKLSHSSIMLLFKKLAANFYSSQKAECLSTGHERRCVHRRRRRETMEDTEKTTTFFCREEAGGGVGENPD